MAPSLNIETLLKQVQEAGYSAEHQKEMEQIALKIIVEEVLFPTFLRILPDGPFIQIIAFLPLVLEPQHLDELARQLHYINKVIDVPGFGLDDDSNTLFYRMVLPALTGSSDVGTIRYALKGIERACKLFAPTIGQVTSGQLTYSQYREQLKKER